MRLTGPSEVGGRISRLSAAIIRAVEFYEVLAEPAPYPNQREVPADEASPTLRLGPARGDK